MRDRLRQNRPASIPIAITENDSWGIKRLKRLVEQMIRPEASDRCTIVEVCREIQQIRGKFIELQFVWVFFSFFHLFYLFSFFTYLFQSISTLPGVLVNNRSYSCHVSIC